MIVLSTGYLTGTPVCWLTPNSHGGMLRKVQNKEQQIIELFRRGDASAMDELYACYADYLTAVCYRYIPDDDKLKDVLAT